MLVVQTMQQLPISTRDLLTAREVQDVLHIDRSTVYRMADDGRLPAIRVGKQWRFPRDEILALLTQTSPSAVLDRLPVSRPEGSPRLDTAVATAAIDVASELLGVMMVITDMTGQPVTHIANPCPWFVEHRDDPELMATCTAEWHQLADAHDFEPEFQIGAAGFECARAFIRAGRELVGMVLAGGVCPAEENHPDLHHLTAQERTDVLRALPKIASAISRQTSGPSGTPMEVRP